MDLDKLRARHAAKQHPTVHETKSQAVDVYANPATGQVFVKFTSPCDHLLMTLQQALDHGYKVISAAAACGAKPDMKELEAEMERSRKAAAAVATKPEPGKGN